MANYAFLSLWSRNFSTGHMLDLFERVLRLFPASERKPGFYSFTIRGVNPQESPILQQDDACPLEPAMVLAMAREFLHDDCAYELVGYWDLWHCSIVQGKMLSPVIPTRVEFACYGLNYDGAASSEIGHFCLQLNFEHLYTGHADLLLASPREPGDAADELEQEFWRRMQNADVREVYRLKTCGNIQKLLHYVDQLEKQLPLDRRRLWSEGESEFEEKLRGILSI